MKSDSVAKFIGTEDLLEESVVEKANNAQIPVPRFHISVHLPKDKTGKRVELVYPILVHI